MSNCLVLNSTNVIGTNNNNNVVNNTDITS